MNAFRPMHYVNISIFGFGLAAMSTSLGQIVLPMRVLDVAPESLKNTYLGVLTFSGMAMAMLIQPMVGYLSDKTTLRWGRRRPYIALGTILTTILLIGIGVTKTYPWLVGAAVLVQMSANLAQSPYDAIIKDKVPRRLRGRASSVRAFAGAAGAIMFVLATGFLMDHHAIGQRDFWLWLALALPASMMVATMAWTLIFVKETEQEPPNVSRVNKKKEPVEGAHPQLTWILLAGFFFTLASGILQTYILFFFRDVVELENPASSVGIMAAAVGLTIIIVLYPAGILADRIGRRPLLIASAIFASTGSLLLLFAQDLTQVILIGILMGVAVGIFMTAGRALITDMVSETKAAQQLGIANFALLGGLAVAKLGGVGIDVLNRQGENLGYYVLLVLCAISFLIAALFMSSIKLGSQQTPAS